ncbi:MAG TPA: phytanoyl-CoA dioxygenase family protein [Mycobacteriales bacterium]|nr:phytanoyl-CoA dioxygenase family protein [Mycobacteriales bacterium]
MSLLPATTTDPALLAAAARGLDGALTFVVDDRAVTFRATEGTVVADEGTPDGDVLVRLERGAWDDLVSQVRTPVNLHLSGDLAYDKGGFGDLAAWEVALRYLLTGVPPYDPARTDLRGRDPRASYTLAAGDTELREQLHTMGYLHVRGVFTADEVAAANAEVDRLAALAVPGDERSWWVTDEDDQERLCRLVYASLRSELLAGLQDDPRISRLGHLLDPALRLAPDRMEGTAVLIKVPGKTQGLSNIPWHQDCGMGGHGIFCPSVSIGVQLTGSSPDTGNLLMVPGSHGQALAVDWHSRLADAPVIEVDTAPGDVTVHVQDVMHASPRPKSVGGRRTMYVTFYPATLWDHIGPGEAYNDLVRNRTREVAGLA